MSGYFVGSSTFEINNLFPPTPAIGKNLKKFLTGIFIAYPQDLCKNVDNSVDNPVHNWGKKMCVSC